MIDLPAAYLGRMRKKLGGEYADFLDCYSRPPVRAIRINTLKISAEKFAEISPFALEKTPFGESGFYADGELGRTVLHAAGLYYVQEPSAMAPAPELGVKAGERVLDMCSAPGGKGTQLAQYLGGEGVIVLNEINGKRFEALRSNAERLGVKNSVLSNLDPEAVAQKFCGYFDKILVDAPCSGEGMFRKDEGAIAEWSEENVAVCAVRQLKILDSAHRALAAGGRIVYSTCTFSDEEDGGVVRSFLSSHPEYELVGEKTLYPHRVRGEGHYYAVLQHTGELPAGVRRRAKPAIKPDALCERAYRQWEEETLTARLSGVICARGCAYMLGDMIYGELSDLLAAPAFDTGVFLGRLSEGGKRFVPSHRLAMCLKADEARHIETDGETAIKYLRGMTFGAEGAGWRLVTHLGYPLGWCKLSGGIAKNHLPKGVRI